MEVAQTVNELFERGVTDPSAKEIAEAHFPGKALAGEIIESVRKRLNRIRDVLEEDLQHPVCLLSKTYYVAFRGHPPETDAGGRRCIPVGYGKVAMGIWRQSGEDDRIWQAMVSQNLNAGAGKVGKSANRTLAAVEGGRLPETRAAVLINRARRKAAPADRALESRVMKALPKAEKRER